MCKTNDSNVTYQSPEQCRGRGASPLAYSAAYILNQVITAHATFIIFCFPVLSATTEPIAAATLPLVETFLRGVRVWD